MGSGRHQVVHQIVAVRHRGEHRADASRFLPPWDPLESKVGAFGAVLAHLGYPYEGTLHSIRLTIILRFSCRRKGLKWSCMNQERLIFHVSGLGQKCWQSGRSSPRILLRLRAQKASTEWGSCEDLAGRKRPAFLFILQEMQITRGQRPPAGRYRAASLSGWSVRHAPDTRPISARAANRARAGTSR